MNAKVISIDRGRKSRMIKEIIRSGPHSVAYLCAKYGAGTFLKALVDGDVMICDQALVYVNR